MLIAMMEPGALGKKVFFLYPPPVLTEVVEGLAAQEYEVYLAKDHERLRRVLARDPDSVVFVNIDEALDEPAWAAYVAAIRSDAATAHVGVGVMSLNEDLELKQKYLMELQVPCGFVTLKIGAAKTLEILSKTLEANEARGRRKFVRATCAPGATQFVIDLDGRPARGELTDLSSAGAALSFEGGLSVPNGTVLRGLQLTVKGARLILDAIVVARREGLGAHVAMFLPASIDEAKKARLRNLVFKLNQASMERVFESA